MQHLLFLYTFTLLFTVSLGGSLLSSSSRSLFSRVESEEIRRCGTHSVGNSIKFAPEYEEELERDFHLRAPRGLRIPMHFHVFTDGTAESLPERSQILEQVRVMNKAFGQIKFSLNGIDVIRSEEYYNKCGNNKKSKELKALYALDTTKYLNVYVCAPGDVLGFVDAFPDEANEENTIHGVTIHKDTLPGGEAPYDLGATLVHEAGHFFGLYHTFQGPLDLWSYDDQEVCNGRGDFVGDTPPEASPNYGGCSGTRDTCPDHPGLDPVENFMDYSRDTCLNHFTPGQFRRMKAAIKTYKQGLLSNTSN